MGWRLPDLTVISLLAQVIASKKLGEVSEGRLDEVNSFGYVSHFQPCPYSNASLAGMPVNTPES
jgi:hypothetical protein